MSRNKSKKLKSMLGRAARSNRRVPLFVMAKTGRKVTQNLKKRHWRTRKLKIKERNIYKQG
jgi:large subunit ribosomal protein L39e